MPGFDKEEACVHVCYWNLSYMFDSKKLNWEKQMFFFFFSQGGASYRNYTKGTKMASSSTAGKVV